MKRPNNPKVDYHGILGFEDKLPDCSRLSKDLLELEYKYAQENALLTITQRGAMMRVYLAIVAIIIAAAFALLRDENAGQLDFVLLGCLGTVLFSVSVYYMSGLIILRSDWFDYIKAISHIKIYSLNLEQPKQRAAILGTALMFHPENIPKRNLTTNFFFHSFAVCFFIAMLSFISFIAVIVFGFGYAANYQLTFEVLGLTLFAIFGATALCSFFFAKLIWTQILK
ncbi:MAG: hypothetical protein AAF198_10295 [Pseudomonadota bacterium]